MVREMWQWKAPGASGQTGVRATEAKGEVEAETAIDVTHAVIGTLQIRTIHIAPQEETSTVVVGALVLDQGRLMVIGIIGPEVEHDGMTTIEPEREAHDVIVMAEGDAHQAPSRKNLHPSLLKTSVIGGQSSFNNSLLACGLKS